MPAKSKDVDVPATLPGMKPTRLEYQAIEDEQEKSLRLHKDRLTFCSKELSVWILAPLLITVTWLMCLVILAGNGWSAAEREWARTGLMAITSGAVGLYFGKQLGK